MIDFLIIGISTLYALILLFGYTVYQHNTKRPANQYFYWLSITFVIWLLCNSMQLITTGQISIFFLYADYVVAPWGLLFLFLFTYHLPDYYKEIPRLITLTLYAVSGFLSILVINQLVISDVIYNGSIPVSNEAILHIPYTLTLLSLVFVSVGYLIYHLFTLEGIRRTQIVYILTATILVFVTLTVINLLFTDSITNEMQFVLNNLSLAWILLVGWSIKHDLFTIQNISAPLVQAMIITILGIGTLWAYDTISAITGNLAVSDMAWRILYAVIVLPIIITLYSIAYNYIGRFLSFNQSVISIINDDIQKMREQAPTSAQEITNMIDDSLYQVAGIFPVWIFKGPTGWYMISQRSDVTEITPDISTHIIRKLNSHKQISVASELIQESLPQGKKNQWAQDMKELGIEVIYPLSCTGETDESVYGAMLIYNESPFLGNQELSYIKKILPQVNPLLYKLTNE